MIRGIKFVSIPVVDQDRALAFYTEKLGFRVATDQPFDDKQRWIELAIPGAETGVVLFRMDGGPQPGGFMNMSLWTDDVTVTARKLKCDFCASTNTRAWSSLSSGSRICTPPLTAVHLVSLTSPTLPLIRFSVK